MPRTPYSGRKYTREQLLDAWEKSTSINDCITRLNMRVSGAAYKSISKILAYEGLIPEPVATKTSYDSPLTYDQSPAKIDQSNPSTFLCRNSNASTRFVRKYIIKNNILDSKTCSDCDITSWHGKILSFHLDHIDGDNRNHSIDNLRFLCPNCHSCTETFGRSKTYEQDKIKNLCATCKVETVTKYSKTKQCASCKWAREIDPEFIPHWGDYPFSKPEFVKVWNENTSVVRATEILFKARSTKRIWTVKNIGHYLDLSNEHYILKPKKSSTSEGKLSNLKSKYLVENSSIGNSRLIRILKEFNLIPYVCECGISDYYNNKDIVLQLEHINGIRNDNRLENLKFLCPNCHSLTETYGAKNMTVFATACSIEGCENLAKMNAENLCDEHYLVALETCECGNWKSKKKEVCGECGGYRSRGKALENKSNTVSYCCDCGKEVSKKSSRCAACNRANAARNIPSRNSLLTFLAERNGKLYKSGENFGVTDNTVKKWLKKYDVPYRSADLKSFLKDWQESSTAR